MSDEIRMSIELPLDDDGMMGRQCPDCHMYFKLTPGTGIQDIETTACPYCAYQSDTGEFHTPAQIEYAKSIAIRRVVGPMLDDLKRSFRQLERSTRNSMIQFKVRTSGTSFPIKYYFEEDLETSVTCDNCGLIFAVYGVFAQCPDCQRPNSMSMFKMSMEVARKRLRILDQVPESEGDLQESILIDALSAAVSTFDGLGKRLRQEFPELLPDKPHNLFQNIRALEVALKESLRIDLESMIGSDDYELLKYMFQVRHIWIHNLGEADQAFIDKTSVPPSTLGAKVVPPRKDLEDLFSVVEQIGVEVRKQLGDSA